MLTIGKTPHFFRIHHDRKEFSGKRLEISVYVGARDGKFLVLSGPLGTSEFSPAWYPAIFKAQPLSPKDLTVNCVVSSTGQFLRHSVHDPRQGEGGPCPEGGGGSQREPRRDDGESASPGPTFLRG